MLGILFFIFASCEPLMQILHLKGTMEERKIKCDPLEQNVP